MNHVTKGPKETQKLGHFLFAPLLKTNSKGSQKGRSFLRAGFNHISLDGGKNALVITLAGELGAGKTTLVQGLAKILGIQARVKSPTFTLMKKYALPRNSKLKTKSFLYHLDCYRLKDHKDLILLGIKDILKDKENVILIEWPERIKKILPKNHIKISIKHVDKNTRKIVIK